MKKYIISFLFIFLITNVSYSQCRDFTYNEVVPKLDDFLLTGKYHSMELNEGEEVLIFKTVNRGLTYRFVVMSESNIPQPNFIISDWNNKVIFDNIKNNNSIMFDYKSLTTQRIKIIIKVPKSNSSTKMGCVGLVIGVKND